MVSNVKFCFENYKNLECQDNLKAIIRFENQEEFYIELN
jgi:hypothetical protein